MRDTVVKFSVSSSEVTPESSESGIGTQIVLFVEPSLECCLGNNVSVYVQVKACPGMTFASGKR